MELEDLEPLKNTSHGVRLPEFILEDVDKKKFNLFDCKNNADVLKKLALDGLDKKIESGIIDAEKKDKYLGVIDYEMGVFVETKFVDYILLVWDVVNFCKRNKIPTGYGRGSAASSLVNYLVGITEIDSLENNLYFERFISKNRAKSTVVDGVTYLDGSLVPDIDTDICYLRRAEVIEYLENKYPGKFCKLSIFSTFQSKALVKDICKAVLAYTEEQSKKVSDCIPVKYGRVYELEEAYENSAQFKEFCDANTNVYDIAKKLHGLSRNIGSHASAYLVCYDKLDDFMPIQNMDGEFVTCLDMNYAQKQAIKLDLLGLKAATLVDSISEIAGIDHNKIDVKNYETIYKHLKDLDCPYGLFQISGDCNFRVVKDIKPSNLDQLSAVVAIARPGALSYLKDYAEFTNKNEVSSVHEFFDSVLSETGGLPLYQEQTLAMVIKMGFSPEEAETLRRIIGKKDREKMAPWEQKIRDKVNEKGLDPKIADVFWKLANESADYSFNKSCGLDTEVTSKNRSIIKMRDAFAGEEILCYDVSENKDHYVKILDIDRHEALLWHFEFNDGSFIECSMEHKFLCSDNILREIGDIIWDHSIKSKNGNLVVSSYRVIGTRESIDFWMDHEDHNFYANDLVTKNSHSAAYSTMAAKLVYLKFNHPKEFYLGCLKMAQDRADCAEEINEISKEMRYLGYDLLPPDILKSSVDFTVEDGGIRFGLGSVKGIAEKAIPKLRKFVSSKTTNKFEVFAASKEAKINIGIFSSLIQAGAISSLSLDRPKTVLEAQIWGVLTDREKRFCLENGASFKYDLLAMLKTYPSWLDKSGNRIIKDSRIETIRKKFTGYWAIYQQNSQYPKLAAYFYEKKALGYSYSYSLQDIFEYKNNYLCNTKQIKNNKTERDHIDFVGEIISAIRSVSAKGEEYLKIVAGDEFGNQEFMFYGYKFTKYLKEGGEVPEEKDIVYIEGSAGKDIVWVDKMAIQNYSIFTKLSDLKNIEEE